MCWVFETTALRMRPAGPLFELRHTTFAQAQLMFSVKGRVEAQAGAGVEGHPLPRRARECHVIKSILSFKTRWQKHVGKVFIPDPEKT